MPQIPLSSDWLNQFTDPYAVLGLSVAADERRVLKRYRTIAKLLHPDSYAIADLTSRQFAHQLLARVVNSAYQSLKLDKQRVEALANLRFRVRCLNETHELLPQYQIAQQLLSLPDRRIEVFYEQAVAELADYQFHPLKQFEPVTQQLMELNLVYLHLTDRAVIDREKRMGLVAMTQAKPVQYSPSVVETADIAISYGQRHYRRAQEYAKKDNWTQVVVELRDAIRLEPTRSEYHSLLAKAYLMQRLVGMAKVHFRQALKFNPHDPLALEYAARLDLTPASLSNPTPRPSKGGLFNLFAKRR